MSSPDSRSGAHSRPTGIEAEMRHRYSAIRRDLPAAKPVTVLQIGAEQTGIAAGSGSEPAAVLALAIGCSKTASEHFKHTPPTPAELENAIQTIEDEITRARSMTDGHSMLFTTDAVVREIALAAGLPDQPEILLSIDAVERTFERVAALALGQLPAPDSLPRSNAFAASVLILREFMHHLEFSTITIKNRPVAEMHDA